MKPPKEYFDLPIETLRLLGGWAADCAERALPIYEAAAPGDARPRQALMGIRLFAGGGKRAAKLRVLALDAYRAALESLHPAAAAAAQAASLAAASAYTHPFADVHQARHILGPAAHAALAVETYPADPQRGDELIRWAAERAPREVCELLLKMPRQPQGQTRLDQLLWALDTALRHNR